MPESDGSTTAAGAGRALVLHPFVRSRKPLRATQRAPEARLVEAKGLALAIDLKVAHAEVVALSRTISATLLGRGTVSRFAELIAAIEVEVVIIDAALSPVQQRNLERAWGCKVIDRTALILEIFGARARAHEGKLQVELAALSFQRSRLVRSWTHLERQRGGFGFTGGPGESQLEIDRRLIDERIVRIKKELSSAIRTRELHRAARRRAPFPVVALVGYTNAGKSTLFNRLTRAQVDAKDLLFATLDPTMRLVDLPSGRKIILSDTVGFISDLPTHLIAAFRATLDEVLEAELILHIRDSAHTDSAAQRADVVAVMGDLGLSVERLEGDVVEVMNKIDLLAPDERAGLCGATNGRGNGFAVSAKNGDGCAALLAGIDGILSRSEEAREFDLAVTDGAAIAWLYRHAEVVGREDGEARVRVRVNIDPDLTSRFERQFGKIGLIATPSDSRRLT